MKFKFRKGKVSSVGNKYLKIFNFTFGQISFASFVIAAVSGVFLAIPFDIKNPYDSISYLLLTNPAGVFFRNIHYWSAQLFLVFSVLHIYDHLKKSSEKNIKNGVWLRVSFSLLIIFFVMLSGFIIKADADSTQAKRIISSLIEIIPFIGKQISVSLLGPEKDFQILYVHHIATATIFLWLIIIEHAKLFWPKLKLLLYLLPVLLIIGYLFPPVLHDGLSSAIKGPWYFLGLQEILHWLSFPWLIILLITVFLFVFFYLPKFSVSVSNIIKKLLLAAFVIYSVLIIIGYFFRGEDWKFVMPWNNPVITGYNFDPFINTKTFSEEDILSKKIPVILGRREGCLFCHSSVKGFSPAHNPEAIGCVSCHSGNPFTLEKNYAHKGLFLIPGNLSDSKKTCGSSNCHNEIAGRIDKTLMTTLSGIVSVDKYVFNETDNLNKLRFIEDISHTPADSHLRNLCASCHLGGKKEELGPIMETSRGGGCNACHLNYNDLALNDLSKFYKNKSILEKDSADFFHPSLSIQITDNHCFGCHSRSGRISTNYEGWHETLLKEINDTVNFRTLDDGRIFSKVQDDVHHQKGMNCIDCHTSRETMGDGNFYLHQEEQVKIKCTDCHFTGKPRTKNISELDQESRKIISLRKFSEKNKKFLVIEKSNNPLINTFIDKSGEAKLITKIKNDTLPLKPPSFVCIEGKGHKNLSCKSCHTSWSPQCVGCHTIYNSNGKSYDLLSRKEMNGEWIEFPTDYLAEPPAFGITENKNKNGETIKTVDTFIPGMILTIEKKGVNSNSKENKNAIFKRLYAPTSSHTITKQSRSCESCHSSSAAIGFGRGQLEFIKKTGKWIFKPEYELNKHDNLPEDAWIGFLQNPKPNFATRTNVRPFNVAEQKKILTVGACLTCHKSESNAIKKYLAEGKIPKISEKCILPNW